MGAGIMLEKAMFSGQGRGSPVSQEALRKGSRSCYADSPLTPMQSGLWAEQVLSPLAPAPSHPSQKPWGLRSGL